MSEALTTAEDQCWADPSELRPTYIRHVTHNANGPDEKTTTVRIETDDTIVEVQDRPVFEARRISVPGSVINVVL